MVAGCYTGPSSDLSPAMRVPRDQHGRRGNFARVTNIPMPYRAMVVKGTKVREMKTLQTDGDCNGCHTEKGNGSPVRIMMP